MSHGESSPRHRIISYFNGAKAGEDHIVSLRKAADRLTHVNYAFGKIDADGRATLGDPEPDIHYPYSGDGGGPDDLRGNFRQIQLIKQQYPHLKTLISIGGWSGSGGFSDAAATPEGREAFASSCIELFLTRWPGVFDGIDIDWEYPVHGGLPGNGYRPEDRRNCTLLFEELRRQLDALEADTGQYYPLTAAIPAGKALPTSTFELRDIATLLDWINLMTYDISGSAESGITGFNAALRADPDDPRDTDERSYQNVDGTVRVFLEAGVPRDKLVVGMPFFGRGYTGVPDVNHGLYQPFSGTISARYHEISRDYLPTFTRHWHADAGVPWLYDAERQTMLTYDDPESIGRKAEYVVDHSLGGAMFWELSGDDAELSLLSTIADQFRV